MGFSHAPAFTRSATACMRPAPATWAQDVSASRTLARPLVPLAALADSWAPLARLVPLLPQRPPAITAAIPAGLSLGAPPQDARGPL